MSDRLLKESDVMRIAFQLPLVVNSAFADAVKALPSADRPQGEWIHDDSSPIAYRCTACNTLQHWSVIQNGQYHFCPNCGAKMKGE
jgi:DNA-directed RNA polymerase subunit RPC12/RpoP